MASVTINLNRSSAQPFYQERLASAYILESPIGQIPKLSDLLTAVKAGAPLQMIGATGSFSGLNIVARLRFLE